MNANVINNNESILEPLIENAILNAVKWIEIDVDRRSQITCLLYQLNS